MSFWAFSENMGNRMRKVQTCHFGWSVGGVRGGNDEHRGGDMAKMGAAPCKMCTFLLGGEG